MARVCVVAALAGSFLAGIALGEVRKFTLEQPGARNLGVWRLTNDPAVRDEANYHNIQCWSPNGRYTCHTHWGGSEGPGGKGSAEIHVVDLATGEDRLVDRGINPRWAPRSNRLFFAHYTNDGKPPTETGVAVIMYDADTGERQVITHGVECPGGLDATETWFFGTQRFRGQKPEFVTVRCRVQPNAPLEILKGAPNSHGYVIINPRHPVLKMRAKDPQGGPLSCKSALFNLDGSNLRIGVILAEGGHICWRGDGEFLLLGNKQVCGRPWDKPFPSDIEVMSWGRMGDICPADTNGRYIVGGNLNIADTRSGDWWTVVVPHSNIVYPMAGDNSELIDINPKGSPDGTKIHFSSTRDLENLVIATLVEFDPKKPDVIRVDKTDGFDASGDMVCGHEVIGYARKTPTTFEGLTRQKYGTRQAPIGRKAPHFFPFSAFALSAADRARARPDGAMVAAKIPADNPLLYQRQGDCYVVVARRPFAPHLRLDGGRVELIPGENHAETRGYRLLRNGQPLSPGLLASGAGVDLSPGEYTAVAVEWSGLESPASLALKLAAPARAVVLPDAPAGFSWTSETWRIDGKPAARDQAVKAPAAAMELVHLHDGVIAREEWRQGDRASRVDLNAEGKPIRHLQYAGGRLARRTYKTPDGLLASEETFGEDGFKTEYVTYFTDPALAGKETDHWWYSRGSPVKRVRRGETEFDLSVRP